MSRAAPVLVAGVALAFALACGSGDVEEGSAVEAGAIAKQIRADPARAAAILEANGLDESAWGNKLYEIAKDPAASGQYAAALR
jgi:hypothetical protein